MVVEEPSSRPKPGVAPTDFSTTLTDGKSAMSYALSGLTTRHPNGSEDSWASDSSEIASIGDPGRTHERRSGDQADSRSRSTTAIASHDSNPGLPHHNTTMEASIPGKSNGSGRRKSIQVVIEESQHDGKYTLTADDPEFRDIIRSGLEREAAQTSGKSRNRIVFTRQFSTFDRQNTIASQSPFHGFFTLFWLAMFLLLCKIAAQNYRNTGSVFGRSEMLHLMVDRDLFLLLVTDGVMVFSTGLSFVLQKAIAKDYLTWSGSGRTIQSLWQVFFTGIWIWITFYREWPWTHTVFIVLHDFALLMKLHSYAFYNGYLSQVARRKRLLEHKLKQLDGMEPQEDTSQTSSATGLSKTNHSALRHRRHSSGPKHSTNFSQEDSDIASMAKSIEAGQPLDASQIQAFTRMIRTEITILDDELRGKCTTTSNTYPNNLTAYNFVDWTCLPTLVYELEYPRQESINWWYVAEKSAATLGVIWIMIIISQAYIYPVVVETVRLKEAGMTLNERWKEFPWVLSDMLFPLLLEQLLAWYVIWECVLNVLAEVTCFADRGFYGDWWNSVSWDQYARDWNRPVHNFLLRHVYHSSISAFKLSKMKAMLVTFLLSAVVHEVLMVCLFHKLRGYLFVLQLSQVPLAMLSKTRLMKGRDTLGNLIFWIGLFIGPSMITSLYLIV
ncbi:sterol o-acyltransferas-like protein 2 [Amniculicola lignicola CBS 123094]|uniref:O-acyltransferase n=1 Tax=Amniculicola lignicola CBS 123094 TaxID=1392246 RepID=A0A6A5WVP5_9PLEO|nr:sterol o-acyltransferas-like protein 2 [Amniculicola lignicola CBS 123094]